MLSLISKEFAVSVRPELLEKHNGIQFYTQNFATKKTLDLGVFLNAKIEDSFCQAGRKLQSISKNSNDVEVDILFALKKTWWQYKDNVYNIHLSIENNKEQMTFLLILLEFYVRMFSIEMAYFLSSLSLSDKKILQSFIVGDIDLNDSYYSELLEIKSFFHLCASIHSGC